MNAPLKAIRHNPLLWMLVVVPGVSAMTLYMLPPPLG
jgi:hypothetical protein